MDFMSEFCFVCLGISKSLTDLLKSPSESKSTLDKLHSCVAEIEWSKSQQLLICDQCIIRLNIAYEFKKQCVRSHEAIQKCIQTQRLYSGIQDQDIKDPVNKNTKLPIPNLNSKNGQLTAMPSLKILPKTDVYPAYTNIIVANSQTKSFQNVFLNLIPTSMLNIASASTNVSNKIATKPILQIPQLTSLKTKEKKKLDDAKDVDVAKLLNESKSEELSVDVDPLVFETQENISTNQIDDWEDIISTQIVSQKTDEKIVKVSTESVYDEEMDFFNSGHFLFQDTAGGNSIICSGVECEACGARFGDVKSLRTHIRVNHSGDFPHKCPFCSEEFAVKKHFDSHVRKHEMQQVLTLKDFSEQHELTLVRSADSSDDSPPYECLPCERVFNTEQGLALHTSRRHKDAQQKHKKTYFIKGKKSAQCDICQRMFSTHSYLVQHKKLHERGLQRRGRAPNKEHAEVEEFMSRMGEQDLTGRKQGGKLNSFAASFMQMIKNNTCGNSETKRSPYVTYTVPKKVTFRDIPDVYIVPGDDYADSSAECDVAISNERTVDINRDVSDEEYTPQAVKKTRKRKRGKEKLKTKLELTPQGDQIIALKTNKKKQKIVDISPNDDTLIATNNTTEPTATKADSSLNGADLHTRSSAEAQTRKDDDNDDSDDQYKYICVGGKPQCSYCQKLFGRKHDLRRHLNNVHLKAVQYVCHVCQKVFYEGFHLTRHLKSHFCYFHCAECSKMFVYVVPDFKNHLAHVHQNGAGAVCGMCRKTLPKNDLDALKSHMDVHFKAIAYTCHLCASEFRDCRDLSKHLAEQHTGPIRCATCRKTFQTEQERNRHQARRHHCIQSTRKVERARIQCEFCSNTYLKRRYLRQHQKNVHGKDTGSITAIELVENKLAEDTVSVVRTDSEPIDLSATGAT